MIHYLDETTMAYTGCYQLPDNGIRKLDTTDNVDKVTCGNCVDAILIKWDKEATKMEIHYIDYYLNEYANEIAKEEFDNNLLEGHNTAYVLYVGGGFQPLGIAVLTFGQDVSSCYTRFEEWARKNDRLDEIGEEDVDNEFYGEYEAFHRPYKP